MTTKELREKIDVRLGGGKSSYLVRAFLCVVFLCTGLETFAINFCSKTSWNSLRSCRNEVREEFWNAMGNCANLPTVDERHECREEAQEALVESKEECFAQFDARQEVCEDLGPAPYHPEIDPSNFPYTDGVIPSSELNPFLPLVQGTTFVYEGGDEVVTVTVTDDIKEIIGVNCIAVRDVVEEDGEAVEDTIDWYAQDVDGNVWYFGEISKNFEDGELVDIEGSWKAGVDGAKPGIVMKANPEIGEVYRQEFFLGEAEDMGEVLDLNGSAEVAAEGADCSGDCLVTADFTPIEPDALEHKYYKPGIGFVLETKPGTDERLELVEIIVDDSNNDDE